MKYETPELTVLTPAINAIQSLSSKTMEPTVVDSKTENETIGTYQDWES
jgi:hypothetical protein